MITLAFPRSTAVGLQAAKDLLLLQPYCFRAHDVMCDFAGVSTLHTATLIGSQALEHFLSDRLPAVDDLPASVRDRLDGKIGLVAVAELLDRAGAPAVDDGEPSWAILGHRLRETRFVQVFRRLHFMKEVWSVPTDDYWNAVRGDVAGHRYRPYLETLALTTPETATQLRPVRRSSRRERHRDDGIRDEPEPLVPPAASGQGGRGTSPRPTRMRPPRSRCRSPRPGAGQGPEGRGILKVSPYHPYARAVLIEKDWDKVKDQVVAWRKEPADSPAVLAALGRHDTDTRNYDEAQRVLSRYIELSPDYWAYQALAANYKAQGKIDRWQQTLDEFLSKVEDLGLDHARVRVEVANYYMEPEAVGQGQAVCGSRGADVGRMGDDCAGRCAEGENDWERAEAWFSRVRSAIPRIAGPSGISSASARVTATSTGRAAVQQYLTTRAARRDFLIEEGAGYFHWLEGDLEKAKAELAVAYEKRTSILSALCLAMIADDEKDSGRRNELIQELVTKHKDKAPKSVEICRLFLDTVFAPAGREKPLDLAAVDRVLESIPEIGRSNAEFFVAWFLKNHGDPQDAKKYLQHCAESHYTVNWYHFLAQDALKRLSADR